MAVISFQVRAAGGYSVAFAYNRDLVDLIKTLPRWDREWDSDNRQWLIHSKTQARVFARQAERLGHVCVGIEQAHQPKAPPRQQQNWAEILFARVGASRHDAVYRALSKVLHPDTSTGDSVMQRELNDAKARLLSP